MATDSALATKVKSTPPGSSATWDILEAAVQVLYEALGGTSSGYPAPNTTAAASPSRFQNLGANATLNVKATAGNVFSLTCFNANASARYLLLHNSATVSSGAPLYSFLVPAGAQIIVGTDFFTTAGVNFSTGIAFGFSTTRDTYTAGTASDQTTVILYA